MVKILSLETRILPDETEHEFIQRLCDIKDELGITWNQLANIANSELGYSYSESWYRKNYKNGLFLLVPEFNTVTTSSADCCGDCDICPDSITSDCEDSVDELEYEAQLNEKLRSIMMKKVEVSDLVASNNAMIRRLSREQTIKDIAHDFAQEMTKKPLITPASVVNTCSGKEGILLISDWHYGLICDNYWNKFSPDICQQRVSHLLSQVIDAVKFNKLEKITVLDLSDLIAGRIHSQIRIESRFDVITQTMKVSEILAEFLSELSIFCPVDFYSCLDNHSRLEPNKKESLDLESLVRIIPWYLKERLNTNARINICDNKHGDDIITCTVMGHKILGVHGHDDSPTNGLDKLSMFTRDHYDMLCMAHRHHMFFEEQSEAIVVSNGCLVGVDSHSRKMRLSSKPSQTLIIVTPENVTDSVKRLLV